MPEYAVKIITDVIRCISKEGNIVQIDKEITFNESIDAKLVKDLSEDTMEMLKYETPLMRIGQPEDIAKCALFLAEQGDFITGQVISSNGGFVI